MNTTPGFQIPFTGLRRQYNNLREEILNTTDQVLSSGQLMNGPWTEQFENWISIKNNDAYAVTCHSGTQALEIIAGYWRSMNVGTNPVVLVPSLTFSATAHAFMRAGWDLHFIDVDVNGLFDPDKIPPGLDYQAVVLVGLYGASVSHIGRVNDWTHWTDKDIIVIEDAAQNWLGNKSNRVGHASAISFDPMKNLACFGNGGAVVTLNQDLALYARSWGNHNKGQYKVLDGASNSRMSELDCAHMMVKTRYINQWQSRRKDIATHMRDRLRNANLRCLINCDNEIKHAYHKFVIEVDHRDQVQGRLWDASIDTRIHYAQPLHDDSVLRKYPGPNMLSVATALSQRVLSLPIYPELTDTEVDYIIDSVIRCVS